MPAMQVPQSPTPPDSPGLPSTCEAIEGCAIPVDVVLQSSDGKLLGAHSKNLEWFTDGFPLSGSTIPSEVVPLDDKGDTLLLFLKFTHNHPAPDLSGLDIDGLIDLAEVADKYCNYFALSACRQPMRALSEKSAGDALKALRFKAIHRDLEGIDAIAQKTVGFQAVYVLKNTFGGNHLQEFAIWVSVKLCTRHHSETNGSMKLQYQESFQNLKQRYHGALRAGPSNEHCPKGYNSNCETFGLIPALRPIAERDFQLLETFEQVLLHKPRDPCWSCQRYNMWCNNAHSAAQSSLNAVKISLNAGYLPLDSRPGSWKPTQSVPHQSHPTPRLSLVHVQAPFKGCAVPVDVVLQSSDGKLLGAHSNNLASFAAGFPLHGTTTQSKITPLSDKGDTLLLFLKFTHNEPAPDLSGLGIDDLLDLAEVADKYCNYFALGVCRHPMRSVVIAVPSPVLDEPEDRLLADKSSENALRVLRFKAIRRDFEGMDPIATKTLHLPITDVIKCFGPNHAQESAIWVLYQQGWVDFTNRYIAKVQSKPSGNAWHLRNGVYILICDDVDSRIITPLRAAVETSTPSLERFNLQVETVRKADASAVTVCDLSCGAYDAWCKAVREVLENPPLWCQFLSY
ncbi:hypothetical protein V5O48_012140 [Marasmius crinis-equi]|uniref:BTB domain-containing protein n=1 Tax=Marasmius crinis-equi TaxID=585013 RepID=A0ABR3F3N5_9AGAR